MSTVRYYRWDDPGAPTLTGEVGSLTNLLRKCLVGTSGVAYGSKPSAGWSEAFTGAAANIAVFRNSQAAGGCGCFVRVNDNAAVAGGKEAYINVYSNMTDVNTGVDGTANVSFRKSSIVNSVARKWLIVADERTAWVHSFEIGDTTYAAYGGDRSFAGFGDIGSLLAAENTYRYFVLGRATFDDNRGGYTQVFMSNRAYDGSLQIASGAPPVSAAFPAIFGTVAFGAVHSFVPSSYFSDLLLERSLPAFSSANVFLGNLRGVSIPLSKMNTYAPGALVSDGVIAVGGNALYGSVSNFYTVAIDSQGPWT